MRSIVMQMCLFSQKGGFKDARMREASTVCLWVGMLAKSVSKSKWEERKLKGSAHKTLWCF